MFRLFPKHRKMSPTTAVSIVSRSRNVALSSWIISLTLAVLHCVTHGSISSVQGALTEPHIPHNATPYFLLYGNVLGKETSNSVVQLTTEETDVFGLVKKLLSTRSQHNGGNRPVVVNSYVKQRLYHTLNDTAPVKIAYLTEENGYLQRVTRQIVLGNNFVVSVGHLKDGMLLPLSTPHSQTNLPLPYFSSLHNFTLTKLRSGDLMVYSHTWMSAEDNYSWGSPLSGHQGKPFTVVTQNIWNFNEIQSYRKRMSKLGKLLVEVSPDVIALQEVRLDVTRKKMSPSQLDHVLKFFKGYQYVFQPAMLDSSRAFVRIEEGVAVLSKYPIVWWTYVMLSKNKTDQDDIHQRILLHVVINTPQLGITHVFNTHLPLVLEARLRCVVEICQYMLKFSGPKFLLGDFNTIPSSDEMAYFRGELPLNGTFCKGFKDVWRDGPQYANTSATPSSRAGLTFNTIDMALTKRIDYIFMSSSPVWDNQSMRIMETKTFGSYGELVASDHRGLSVTVTC